MIPPSAAHDHRVLGPPDGQPRRGADERGVERRGGLLALDPQLAHVRQVEQPGPLADRAVLLEDATLYCTGIRQPAKSIIRAPRASVVGPPAASRGAGPRGPRSRSGLGSVQRRGPGDGPGDDVGGVGHQGPLGLERQHARRLVEVDPADLVELVVVAIQVAADRLHQEVVHGLVDARPGLDERRTGSSRGAPVMRTSRPVSSATSRRAVSSVDSPRFGVPLGRVQVASVPLSTAAADDELGTAVLAPDDDAACRRGGRVPQPGHGAVAARAVRSGPRPPDRVQRIRTAGRGRPLAADGRAGRGSRQPRVQAGHREGTERCSSVMRPRRAGRRSTIDPSPNRRSRARLDGRTNRAAGRAAYLAAMECPMGRNGSASEWPRKRFGEGVAHRGRGRRCQRATGARPGRSRAGPRRTYNCSTPGAWRPGRRGAPERPDVAAGHRPGQRGADAEAPGVAQRPLDERAIDRAASRPRRDRPPAPSSAIASSSATKPPAARTAAAW